MIFDARGGRGGQLDRLQTCRFGTLPKSVFEANQGVCQYGERRKFRVQVHGFSPEKRVQKHPSNAVLEEILGIGEATNASTGTVLAIPLHPHKQPDEMESPIRPISEAGSTVPNHSTNKTESVST